MSVTAFKEILKAAEGLESGADFRDVATEIARRELARVPAPFTLDREHFAEATGLHPLDDERALLGTVYVFGVPYHFHFVEVEEDRDGTWRAVHDPHGRLQALEGLYEFPMQAVKIDGRFYLGVAHPHAI